MPNQDAIRFELIEVHYKLLCHEVLLSGSSDRVARIDAIIRQAERVIKHIDAVKNWPEEDDAAS